jgi:hypothetical protein
MTKKCGLYTDLQADIPTDSQRQLHYSVVSAAPLHAADISRGFGSSEVLLEGTIEAGDCRKLGSFVYEKEAGSIYLASPGGNLAEAMEIGRLG